MPYKRTGYLYANMPIQMNAVTDKTGRIVVPPGYRELEPDEIVKHGDFILSGDKKRWNNAVGTVGMKAGDEFFIRQTATLTDKPITAEDHW